MVDGRGIGPGDGRCVLVVVAHADDATLFLGGTVARWTASGWRVVLVRATDDAYDSVGSDVASTVSANAVELADAAGILGVHQVVELGHRTDALGDASEVALREQIIRQVRTHRPYALVTFDPYSGFGEDNLDHVVVARATDESFWTSQFDLHHPEHIDDGLEPHGCFERWYFGRPVGEVTDVVDIADTLDRKIDAACAHRTMLTNWANQLRLQARTGGWSLPVVDEVLATGDVRPLAEQLVRAGAARTGARHGLAAAEEFRVVRFGGMEALLEQHGRRLA